jgi:TP901 family phage tail tape measure protein
MSGRFTVETVFKGTDQTSSVLKSIQGGVKATQSALSGPISIADKGIEGFKKVGAVAAVAGLAAGAAFHHMVETGADFEQSITNVGAVMGKSRGQIAELEQAALKLGVSTQFSSSEVSEAMEQMARKGFDSQEILAGIPGVLNAIAASGEGMAEVATVVGSSIRGFGLEANDASHVADVLAFSAEKTGAHITEMGSALATVAPTARALGVSIEDAAASVGLLQKMGIDAATAGSATATMLAKISHPSKEAATKMTAMGIAFKDAKGNMLPFRDVLGQFVKAGDKAGGNMDRMSFFAELVGLRGDKAALALADMAKSGDFDKLVAGLKNVDGYSAKVAQIRMDTTQGSWKLLTSTIEVLETKLFDLNHGGLKVAIDRVNAWVSANQELIVSGATEYAGRFTAEVVDLTKNIDKGVQMLGWFKDGLAKAGKWRGPR